MLPKHMQSSTQQVQHQRHVLCPNPTEYTNTLAPLVRHVEVCHNITHLPSSILRFDLNQYRVCVYIFIQKKEEHQKGRLEMGQGRVLNRSAIMFIRPTIVIQSYLLSLFPL